MLPQVVPLLIAGSVLGAIWWFPALRSRILAAVSGGTLLFLRGLVVCCGLAVLWLVVDVSAASHLEAAFGWVFYFGVGALVAWSVAQLRGLVHRPRTPARTTAGIVILAMIFVPLLFQVEHRMHGWPGPRGRAEAQIQNFAMAIDSFRSSYKRLPRDLDELTRSGDRSPHPFILMIPSDPWGNSYLFRHTEPNEPGAPVRHYVISSNGPDGQPRTEDDIVYSSRNGFRRHWED